MIAYTQCNANTSLRGRKAKRYKTKKGRENMADSYLLLCGDRIQQFSIMKIAESRVCLFRRECTPFFPLLQFVTLLFPLFRLYTTITTHFRWRAAICKTEKRCFWADFSANPPTPLLLSKCCNLCSQIFRIVEYLAFKSWNIMHFSRICTY